MRLIPLDSVRGRRMHPEHRQAQKLARQSYYEAYSVQVCEVVREARFTLEESR